MNPLSLLTKGHTIRGLAEPHATYKLLDKSTLPNFSAPENRKEEGKKKKEEPAPPAPASVAVRPVPTPAKKSPPKAGLWGRLASIGGRWMARIPWRKASPFQGATVQTELGLDKVKVIRNDLSEDDLEVVMVEKKTDQPEKNEPAQPENVEHEKMTATP